MENVDPNDVYANLSFNHSGWNYVPVEYHNICGSKIPISPQNGNIRKFRMKKYFTLKIPIKFCCFRTHNTNSYSISICLPLLYNDPIFFCSITMLSLPRISTGSYRPIFSLPTKLCNLLWFASKSLVVYGRFICISLFTNQKWESYVGLLFFPERYIYIISVFIKT